MKGVKLRTKIIGLLVAFALIALVANVIWNSTHLRSRAEQEMLEKTQILAAQMESSWEFIEINQSRIDTDADGSYNFKGLYCAIAGKSISRIFMQKSDYSVRYVSEMPRNPNAFADDFEQAAFQSFTDTKTEYFAITTYLDKDVFRYVTPLYIRDSCMSCHGTPANEIDITGYPKEGMAVGDVGGAISIIMPVDLYLSNINATVWQQALYTFLITVISMIIIFMAMSRLVTKPISKLELATKDIEDGKLDIDISDINNADEIGRLAVHFKSMAEQLNFVYNNLEEQVHSRTLELHEANKILEQQRIQLEEANMLLKEESDYKSEFLTIISHDLRTPLTVILAFTEVWLENIDSRDEREIMAVQEIHENGQLLLQMINNLLEAARIDADRLELHLEPLDLFDLVGLVKRTLGFLAERKGIELAINIASDVPIICADWEKTRRILENLVANAVKYTQRGGHVCIFVQYDEAKNDVVIKVQDDGIGIKKNDLDAIFEEFTQADHSSHRRYKGTGLGLSVVKKLVLAHNGEISAISTYKEGSTFIVRMPVGAMDLHDQ